MKALLDELLLSLAQLNDRFEARFFEGDFDESSARVDCDAAINSAYALQATMMLADLCARHRSPGI